MLLRHWPRCFRDKYIPFQSDCNGNVFLRKGRRTDILNMLLYVDTNNSGKGNNCLKITTVLNIKLLP